MAFVVAITIAPISMVSRCVAIIDTLFCGSALFKETLAIMGCLEDQC